MKYKDWLDEWFTYYVIPNTKARTCEKYRTQIEKHIKPRLGFYSVGKLSAQILQQFTSELTESGFSANTVNGIISVLKYILAVLPLIPSVFFGAVGGAIGGLFTALSLCCMTRIETLWLKIVVGIELGAIGGLLAFWTSYGVALLLV